MLWMWNQESDLKVAKLHVTRTPKNFVSSESQGILFHFCLPFSVCHIPFQQTINSGITSCSRTHDRYAVMFYLEDFNLNQYKCMPFDPIIKKNKSHCFLQSAWYMWKTRCLYTWFFFFLFCFFHFLSSELVVLWLILEYPCIKVNQSYLRFTPQST